MAVKNLSRRAVILRSAVAIAAAAPVSVEFKYGNLTWEPTFPTWHAFFMGMKPEARYIVREWIPSKKNCRQSFGGRVCTRNDVKQRLIDMAWDLKAQRMAQGIEQPVSRRLLVFVMNVAHDGQDADNIETTLLDCMKDASILRNDNTKHARQTVRLVKDAPGKMSRDRTLEVEVLIFPEVPWC